MKIYLNKNRGGGGDSYKGLRDYLTDSITAITGDMYEGVILPEGAFAKHIPVGTPILRVEVDESWNQNYQSNLTRQPNCWDGWGNEDDGYRGIYVKTMRQSPFNAQNMLKPIGGNTSISQISFESDIPERTFAFWKEPAAIDYVVPKNVAKIGEYAFQNFDGNGSSIATNKVKEIGGHAFYQCSGITTLDMTGVEKVGERAFQAAVIDKIIIPETISIENWGSLPLAFCKAKEVVIKGIGVAGCASGVCQAMQQLTTVTCDFLDGEDAVLEMGMYFCRICGNLKTIILSNIYSISFTSENCIYNTPNLTDITLSTKVMPELKGITKIGNFDQTKVTLHVTPELVDTYKADAYWGTFKDVVAIS